jgi:CelD/BcsL family acetyltransferase involved in cellulose biosynthesis
VTVIDLSQRGRAAAGPLKVEVYGGDRLAAACWPSIADDPDLRMYVYQSREFLQIWIDTIGQASRMECYLIVVSDGDGPLFYLPLAIEKKFNVRLLRFPDAGVADYNAPIVSAGRTLSEQDFNAVWPKILAILPGFDVIDLKKIAGDVCGAVNPLTYLECTSYAESGHVMAVVGSRNNTETDRSIVNLRRDLRRHARGLSKLGETNFIVNPPAAESAWVTERLFDLKRKKYARTKVPDFLAAPGVERFYREMAAPGRLGRISHLAALTSAGAVAAAHLGFIGRGRFYYIFPAYDMAYQRYRVGLMLLEHLIDRCRDQQFRAFDLGIGDLSYKDTWATHRLPLYCHERALTAAGRLYLQMRRVQHFVRSTGMRTWLRAAN